MENTHDSPDLFADVPSEAYPQVDAPRVSYTIVGQTFPDNAATYVQPASGPDFVTPPSPFVGEVAGGINTPYSGYATPNAPALVESVAGAPDSIYRPEVYAAAFAEDGVWSAAHRLVEAGALDPDFLQSDRFRTAANAASSAVLQSVAPGTQEGITEAPQTVAETVAAVRARLAPAEGATDGRVTIAGTVETLLGGAYIHPEETTFNAGEISGFADEAAYAAMEVRASLSQSFLVREVIDQQAGPELRVSTMVKEGSIDYKTEYTFGEQSTYSMVRVIARNGTYTDAAGGYARTGILNAAQIERIDRQLAGGYIRHGRLWGAWKVRADYARLERASSNEGVNAYTDLSYAGLGVISGVTGSREHAFSPKQASELQKSGIDWAIDAPSGRAQVSVRAQDGRVRVVKEWVRMDDRRETSASRETYTVSAAEATLDCDFSLGKRRNYAPDRPQQQLNTAEVQALAEEVAGLNPDKAKVWQRSNADR